MTPEQLRIENQLCFPLYAASRLIIKEYQPLLDKLNLTYPQYLVMMVLWEKDGITVNDIGQSLLLNTNTITPLLQRMETAGLLERLRSKDDERKVIVNLTKKGEQLKAEALLVPEQFAKALISDNLNVDDLINLKGKLTLLIQNLSNRIKIT